MRIVCSVCAQGHATPPPAAILGEKCAECGSTDLTATGPSISEFAGGCVMLYARFVCWSCRHIFLSGDGGDSHTLCPAHAAQARFDAGLPVREPYP